MVTEAKDLPGGLPPDWAQRMDTKGGNPPAEPTHAEKIKGVETLLYAAAQVCESVSKAEVDTLELHERRLAWALAQDLRIFVSILRRQRGEDPEKLTA